MPCSWPVNRQTPSPIRFLAPKRPTETAKTRVKPQELTGGKKFVIFFTNSLSTVSAGLWLSTSGGAWRPRIRPHPHDFQFRHRPSARRGARPSLSAAEPGQSQRGRWWLNRIPGGPVLRERKVDSHPETLPVVCSPPGPCGLWVQSPRGPEPSSAQLRFRKDRSQWQAPRVASSLSVAVVASMPWPGNSPPTAPRCSSPRAMQERHRSARTSR